MLETQESFGGTWRTHRYPGIRSDSDLHTFGYRFKPWTSAPIATAAEILQLHGRGHRGERPRPPHPLPAHHLLGAAGRARTISGPSRPSEPTPARRFASPRTSSGCARATTATRRATRPSGRAWTSFKGRIVHPQTWPEDLDYKDKKVIVIGSGATAATLIPAIAGDCAHVTMLQRSPTYFRTGRNAIEIADDPARAAGRRDLDPRDRAPQDPARPGRLHPHARSSEPEAVKQDLLAAVARLSRTRLRHRHPLHAELPAVAAAHRLHSRRRPVPGHQVAARPRSSPTRSTASPRPASC